MANFPGSDFFLWYYILHTVLFVWPKALSSEFYSTLPTPLPHRLVLLYIQKRIFPLILLR